MNKWYNNLNISEKLMDKVQEKIVKIEVKADKPHGKFVSCAVCDGTGLKDGLNLCETCKGSGKVLEG